MCTNMEKIMAENGKIRIICDGHRYRKDSDLAGGNTSFRCARPACRGRLRVVIVLGTGTTPNGRKRRRKTEMNRKLMRKRIRKIKMSRKHRKTMMKKEEEKE